MSLIPTSPFVVSGGEVSGNDLPGLGFQVYDGTP